MTAKTRLPRLSKRKSPFRHSFLDKQLNANGGDVALKLEYALHNALSGDTEGALIIALDRKGNWTTDLAGQLTQDGDALCLIACRLLEDCLASKLASASRI